jgi:threonine dehydrogenase-like Zn-dependent dehydrogenase
MAPPCAQHNPRTVAVVYRDRPMRAVTFQAPGEVLVEDVPDPELQHSQDALVLVEASGICGSDLHIYHGRVPVEQGFTIGHEFVGTVLAVGSDVDRAAVGDRVLGCFHTACGICVACVRGDYHRCLRGRTFGHGTKLGDLSGAQAEQLLVPNANLTLRRVPEGMSADVALFAGDVMGTGYHAISHAGTRAGDSVAVLGLGPVGLCAVQAARATGAAQVFAIDTVAPRLSIAERFGATPIHLTEEEPKRVVRAATEGLGVDVVVDAVGDPRPLELAVSLARDAGTISGIGAYAGRGEVPLGLAWLKGLTIRTGLANVIFHVDRVLAMMSAGLLDPTPLVSKHMSLEDAAEAYAVYDRREALKIVLTPQA